MKAKADGFWGAAHWILDVIGRGAAWFLPTKRAVSEDEVYAMTGGAVVGVLFGGILGLVLSDESHAINVVTGATIGGLVGAWTGMISGAIVQTVDEAVHEWLNSVDSPTVASSCSQPGAAPGGVGVSAVKPRQTTVSP
jgi:hypothetical protein